ncbi:histidine decarboxylase [Micromonospora sp. CA-263727]|uniref:histidine decarboxylase n=1 Tax=Micromonospora sp. CA-263727 TaxID=3239967 RepID=UPI003D930190
MTDILTGAVPLAGAADLGRDPVDVPAVLRRLAERADAGAHTSIGFPGAVDLDHSAVLAHLGRRLWNNIGDPATDPGGAAHTKALERAVVAWVAETLAMPADDRWGYVTSGGTEGNLAALHAAHRRWPNARVYFSSAAHYSIRKILGIIGARGIVVHARPDGEMDYTHLAAQIRRRPTRPAIVVATAGTTMTEAVDDTARIRDILTAHSPGGHLHVDAALSGIPLALDGRLHLDAGSGIDSIAISGHKFFGVPSPCGVVLIREHAREIGDGRRTHGRHIAYTATRDTTISGSRCGLAAAMLWHAIATHGREGHRWRVSEARRLAAYTVERLTAIGWPAWRHPHAFTVVFATPPGQVREKWLLATDGPVSHLVCMPGVTRGQIDAFVTDLAAATEPEPPSARVNRGPFLYTRR